MKKHKLTSNVRIFLVLSCTVATPPATYVDSQDFLDINIIALCTSKFIPNISFVHKLVDLLFKCLFFSDLSNSGQPC